MAAQPAPKTLFSFQNLMMMKFTEEGMLNVKRVPW
jgi:hypothetical protein